MPFEIHDEIAISSETKEVAARIYWILSCIDERPLLRPNSTSSAWGITMYALTGRRSLRSNSLTRAPGAEYSWTNMKALALLQLCYLSMPRWRSHRLGRYYGESTKTL